jgi:hypothetical protein
MMRRAKFRIKLMAGVGVLAAAFLAVPQGAYAATTQGNSAIYPHTGAGPDTASSCDDAGQCINLYAGGAAVLNDWNNDENAGAPIKMYQVYKDNDPVEAFTYEGLTGMCNGGFVSSTCPFTVGSGLNTEFEGDPIVQIFYYGNGDCVATSGSGEAVLGTCANLSGSGGSDGVIDVLNGEPAGSSNCYELNYCYVANRYWFDRQGSGWMWGGNGANGTQVYLSSGSSPQFWGNIDS